VGRRVFHALHLAVTAAAAVLFHKLRRADALTAESHQSAERELAAAEPVD
jgi:hypothetical protein